jgi:uncharacterized protein YqeY
MSSLKDQLNADLTTAMKSRDELTTATLRMALTAVRTEEVAGKSARILSDQEVLAVLAREAKKRREAAEAFTAGGRTELAERERAENGVLEKYLPAQLSDGDLADLVKTALADAGVTDVKQLGKAMKAVQAQVAGRAEGGRVAAEVRRQLTAG